jgi:hypothetical protein
MLVMRSDPAGSANGWQDHLGLLAARVEQRRLEAPEIWLPTSDGSLLVPAQLLQSVVSWSSETYA